MVLTAGNQSKYYLDNLDIGTTCFTLNGTLYNGDTISNTTLTVPEAANTAAPIGVYTIVSSNAVSGPGGNANISNYNITYQNGTLTVMELRSTLVTTATDVVNLTDNITSLREALNYASTLTGDISITFSPSIFSGNAATINLTSGVLTVNNPAANISIQGPSPSSGNILTLSGNNTNGIFSVLTNATLSNLTLANGTGVVGTSPTKLGGAIYSTSNLTVIGVKFSRNTANYGGAIYSNNANGGASLVVLNSSFANINATVSGGAIYNNNGSLTIGNSSFIGSVANSSGGAIYNDGSSGKSASVLISSSTFANNTAVYGGSIFNNGTSGTALLTLDRSTVA